ncbi:MAG: hypothetical protein R2828_33630 [Saprospiraceae bacterium]
MKKRQLTEDEKNQMNITKLFHEKRLKKKFNWRRVVIAILIEIGFILTIYFFDEYWFSLIAKFGLVITPFLIWSWVSSFKGDKEESNKLLKIIQKVEEDRTVEITEYNCKKAIHFEEYEDEGSCYAMEIGENKLMFWWDSAFSEVGILPNTRFEAFENNEIELVLGKRIRILGNPIQPIKIRPEIKWDNWSELPNHREIIESSVDKYLNEIEKKYSILR